MLNLKITDKNIAFLIYILCIRRCTDNKQVPKMADTNKFL